MLFDQVIIQIRVLRNKQRGIVRLNIMQKIQTRIATHHRRTRICAREHEE